MTRKLGNRLGRKAKPWLAAMALLACTRAWADTAPMSDFKPSSPCETIDGYDPDWATYGAEYGLKLKAGKDFDAFFGFYQMVEHGGKLYAAFGGAIKDDKPVKGATPGLLVVLDADTLRFERAIPLPFHAHALALSPAAGLAIATHTKAGAFSIINLATGEVRCRKPDTRIGDAGNYRGRYVAADEKGNFFINYSGGTDDDFHSVVMKYGPDGEHAKGFAIQQVEQGTAMPLLYRQGQVLAGSRGVKAVSADTGEVTRLSVDQPGLTIFNYAQGPGDTVIGANFSESGSHNFVLFDVARNRQSSIFTGVTTLELAYDETAGKLFSSNLQSQTVSVVDLPADARGFENSNFVNVQLGGPVNSLALRQTPTASEVFVSLRFWGDENREKHGLIQKIRIANDARGFDGIGRLGACTVTTFDLRDKRVSRPAPCKLLDEKSSYKASLALADERLKWLEEVIVPHNAKLKAEATQAVTEALQKQDAQAIAEAQRLMARYEKSREWSADEMAKVRAARDVLKRLSASHE